MLNKYMNINRIEFVITNACTSRCKHCSVIDKLNTNKFMIDKEKAASALLTGGVKALIQLAEDNGVTIDTSQHYSACSVCNDVVKKINILECV